MKLKLSNLVIYSLLAVLLVGAVAKANDYGYIPSSRYTGPNSHIYDLGYKDGSEDARKGLSALTSRHGGYTKDQLEIFAQGYTTGYRNYSRPSYSGGGQSYEAFKGQGKVTITRNGREVAVCRTAQPDVEKWHFMEGHEQIVIKSRGERGTAVVQLFDARTGTLRDKVSAYAIRHGEPEWARGMQD